MQHIFTLIIIQPEKDMTEMKGNPEQTLPCFYPIVPTERTMLLWKVEQTLTTCLFLAVMNHPGKTAEQPGIRNHHLDFNF